MTVLNIKKTGLELIFARLSVVAIFFAITTFSCSQEIESSPPRQQQEIKIPHNLYPEVWITLQPEATARDGEPVDVNPSLESYEEPEYPVLPMKAGIQGSLEVEVVIDVTGRVKEPKIKTSTMPPATEWSAIKTIADYSFRPGMRVGEPVECRLLVVVNYELK